MRRRDFITASLASAAALAAPRLAGTAWAGTARQAPAAAAGRRFRLNYAPSFGQFKAHAGTDLASQVAFAADEGFTAMFDNGLMNRPAADQELIVREIQKRNMKLGPFVLLAGFTNKNRIKRSGGELSGGGLALGGLITGYISIAMIPVIAMMAAIAIPNFVKARDTAQRNACINNLRQFENAKQQWALENKKEDSVTPTVADLDKYMKVGFANVKCLKGGTYSINPVGESASCSVEGHELPMLQPYPGTPR